MKTFTATADSKSTIGYCRYGATSWNTGYDTGACQGAYEGTSASDSRVGIMVFQDAGLYLKGRAIKKITFSITCPGAGSGSSSKKLSFRKANYQYINKDVKGSAQVGSALGTLTGKFYENTSTHTLNSTSNSAFFNALKQYLYEGNCALIIYNGEVSGSNEGDYSSNYARINSITITVEYEEATVWYHNGSQWIECGVYYFNGGSWVQVVPYYNSGGSWVRT